jgi:preprotein translocase subunit SecD
LHRRTDRILLVFILVLFVFSLITMWPSDPSRYLPSFIPWPKGQGIDIGSLKRRTMMLGLDLKGGTRLVLEADTTGQQDVNVDEALNGAIQIIENRINAWGVGESEIQRQGSDRIAVQLPGITADEAMKKIGKTALLEFRELKTDANGDVAVLQNGQETYVPMSSLANFEDAVWIPAVATGSDGLEKPLTGRYLTNAYLSADAAGAPVIDFSFNGEGAHLFGQISQRLIDKPLAFFLDGVPLRTTDNMIDAPIVRSQITDKGQITGMSLDDAQYLVKMLKAGAFPVPLKVVQSEDVDATLGADAVQKSVIAGEVAMLVIMLFMILYYRLPGLVAAVALSIYTTVVLAIFKLWPVTLTLSGIAAFVLSVGMAVDANILIFERTKEELRIGRSLVIAMEEGFDRAWPSIRDSNVSTLITCGILFWFGDQFGAALVKGFALTLAIGVLTSMFSAILVTRTFLRIVVSIPAARKLALWVAPSEMGAAASQPEAGIPAGGGG